MVEDEAHLERRASPPLAIALPDDPRVRDLVVKPHRLADYDPETPDPKETEDD